MEMQEPEILYMHTCLSILKQTFITPWISLCSKKYLVNQKVKDSAKDYTAAYLWAERKMAWQSWEKE